ncbi:MAG: sulfatase-like hydrolase/transferase, partial [Armatimonadota bacterium]|nr:sulfatase-like hydrolase/transferase [Armatimonadota bacterium]
YYGMVSLIDKQVGRIVETLARRGLLENTLIVFTSDHGEMLGDHYLFRKCYPYEGSAHIPMLIRGPDVRPGSVFHDVVCLEDIMPTVLELAGCPIPESVEGRSLAPLVRGECTTLGREYLHGEHATCYRYEQANHFLTDGKMKYIWFTCNGAEQLFHLPSDPGERHNLADDPAWAEELAVWRGRLMERLRNRPEGFVEGGHLVPGRPHPALLPWAHGRPRD